MKRAVITATLLIVATSCNPLSGTGGGQNSNAHEIAIAADLPLSGSAYAPVKSVRDAIALAIRDRSTIRGYKVIFEPFDDTLVGQVDQHKAVQNAKLMISDARIVAVVGPWSSYIAWHDIPLTNPANLAMVSPSNTADCLTVDLCYERPTPVINYFRTSATDSAQARAAANFAVEKLHVSRFAVFDDAQFYGEVLTDAFSKQLLNDGGSVVLREAYPLNSIDYSPLLNRARKAGAEAFYVGGFGDGGACTLRAQMLEIMPDAYMLGGDGIVGDTCITRAGAGANDHLLATVADSQPAADNPVSKEFRAHGIQPVAYVFGAYDCARIVLDAIDRAIQAAGGRVPTRRGVLDAIAATRAFHGVTGTFTFLPNGDATTPTVSLYTVQGGHWTYWQNVS